jgi:AraC-like DNA-binding protein
MSYFLAAFYFSLFSIGTMIGLVLIFKNRKSLAYTFFGIYNLITAWGFLVSFLLVSGLILQAPHFFRTAAPFHYLWGPLCYLFIRNLLSSDNRFHKTDILHFLPFALHLVELIPFYLSSTEVKVNMLNGMFSDGNRFGVYEGLLTSYWHSLLKFSQMLIYNIFQWKLVANFNKTKNQSFKKSNQLIINWVVFLNVSGLAMIFIVQYHRIFLTNSNSLMVNGSDVVFYFYYIFIWYYLLYNPDLLNGIKLNHVVPEKELPDPKRNRELKSRKNLEYEEILRRLETHMQLNQPFLNENLNVSMISSQIYSSEIKIAKTIKYKFGINFPEYINQYRIAYIEENLKSNPDWKSYTVEGMAFSAGFNSRNAFYTAFRKIKGVTPTSYFKFQNF